MVNKLRGVLNVCAIKAPGFGERRKALLQVGRSARCRRWNVWVYGGLWSWISGAQQRVGASASWGWVLSRAGRGNTTRREWAGCGAGSGAGEQH